MRNSIYTNNFNNQNALMKTNNQPVLNDAQINDAKLVKKLPSDFPIADWESMNTKAQLKAMQHSGLSDKEQWALLNTTTPLSALNQHNQAQNAVETRATAAKIATTLMSAAAQAAVPRAPVTASKPTNSTPLQTTAQQRKLDMKQEEYETRFYEKQARRPIAVNTQNNTPKTPEGAKPVVDSRDAMEQKKDKLWEKIESTYNPRDAMDRKKDEIWDKVVVPSWRDKREDEIWGKVNGNLLTESDDSDNAFLSQIIFGASTAINKLRDAFKDKYLDLLKKKSDPKATWGTEMINDQSLYSKYIGTFGILGSTARNACGVIAIHNANQLLGFNTRFDDLSYMMQRSSLYTSIEYGLLGMNPFGLANLYEGNGAEVTIYLDPQKVSKDHDAYIAVFSYPVGSHYVAADYNQATQQFEVYNLDTDHVVKKLDTLSAQSYKGTFGWVVWGIDSPEATNKGLAGHYNSEKG